MHAPVPFEHFHILVRDGLEIDVDRGAGREAETLKIERDQAFVGLLVRQGFEITGNRSFRPLRFGKRELYQITIAWLQLRLHESHQRFFGAVRGVPTTEYHDRHSRDAERSNACSASPLR